MCEPAETVIEAVLNFKMPSPDGVVHENVERSNHNVSLRTASAVNSSGESIC